MRNASASGSSPTRRPAAQSCSSATASDRYAAGYADVVFAKRALVPICVTNGWPFQRWTEFTEIHAWLNETLDAWRRDPASAPLPRPVARPFLCGPEVWGPGRVDPPAPTG